MKTTTSKDLVKVNQILPIMQEHFGQSMNLARIKLMAMLLHALCVVQTVSLQKLAAAMPTSVERDSNLRRLHTFVNAAVLYQIAVFDIVLYDFLISPYCVHVGLSVSFPFLRRSRSLC